jgi:hypothetical protein
MLKAAAERIGEEGQSMVPEFLQAWIQLMKAPARSFEQSRRDCLVRVKLIVVVVGRPPLPRFSLRRQLVESFKNGLLLEHCSLAERRRRGKLRGHSNWVLLSLPPTPQRGLKITEKTEVSTTSMNTGLKNDQASLMTEPL